MLTQLAADLWVYRGAVNVGILRDGDRALLIDCGDGAVVHELAGIGIYRVARVLFTHHHRDQASGFEAVRGAAVTVPASERHLFDSVADYWADPGQRWRQFGTLSHPLVLAESIPVDETCVPGDSWWWGNAFITVLDTPGHTDGSVSYQVDLDNQRMIFSGDVIYDAGQIWDLFSLQRGGASLGGTDALSDYHGYMGCREVLRDSLGRVGAAGADLLVPSHGCIMGDAACACELLVGRLQNCYEQYVAISALRHYYPIVFAERSDWPAAMPFAPAVPPPDFLRQIATTWILISQDGAAFVMDCADPAVITYCEELLAAGEITKVEGLWITHYHFDHTEESNALTERFRCPVYADQSVAEVIECPAAYQLPCVSPVAVPVQHRTGDGECWRWHEFTMTAYHLPGQTLHHGGLLVEGRGQRLFFAGDSFTPSGIDDYCMANRNPLGRGTGFDRCIRLLQALRPDAVFNAHVPNGFLFTAEHYDWMLANLAERKRSYGPVLPWDSPNYGIDPRWVRCFPYEQTAHAGQQVAVQVMVTNYSERTHHLRASAVPPAVWEPSRVVSRTAAIGPGQDEGVEVRVPVPVSAAAGRYVVPMDITYGGRELPQITEAIIVVE